LPEAPGKRTGISMRDDAEIIWRIKTPTHATSKHGWISWKVCRSVADWFFATGNLGIKILPSCPSPDSHKDN
jgi:hypothetical protein